MILSTSEYLFSDTADKIDTLVMKRTWSTTSLLHKKLEVNFNLEVNSLDNHSKVFSTLAVIDYMKTPFVVSFSSCIRQLSHSASVILCVSM
jgi:hypothetical protein